MTRTDRCPWRNVRSVCFGCSAIWERARNDFRMDDVWRRRCRPSWKARMRINGYLATLKQPRLWLTVAFVVSQLLQFGPCCCSRVHGSAQSANCCCGEAAREDDASDDLAIVVPDEVCEAPLPHKCRCNKNVCAGTMSELFTVSGHRANFFDDLAQPIASIKFNVGDVRPVGMEGGRRDVVALRGADCCAVLCRWLC